MTTTKVLNIVGGPGAGKSTVAAFLFSEFKKMNINCELVTEWVKGAVWEGRPSIFEQQIYIFAKQLKRMVDLRGKVDVMITDSPLFLSPIYAELYRPESTAFEELVMEEYNEFNNRIIYLLRGDRPYNPVGRNQTFEQAKGIDQRVLEFLKDWDLPYQEVSTSLALTPEFARDYASWV